MRRLLMMCVILGLLVSCQKERVVEPAKEVSFTIGLQLPQSGSMTRATASDLYDEFYTDYVETHEKLPQQYSLIINRGNETILTISGKWDADVVTLPVGTYTITGECNGDFDYATLKFNEEIIIKEDTEKIDLTAQWDCYMLMFDKELYKSVTLYHQSFDSTATTSRSLTETDSIFYLFLPYRTTKYIKYSTNSGDAGTIYHTQYPFEIGKYYAFDLYTGSFSVPQMEQGN